MSNHSPTSSIDSQAQSSRDHIHGQKRHDNQQQENNPFKDAWLNRHATTAATVHVNPNTQFHWRLTRAVLKDGTLGIYKPPSDISVRSFDPTIKPQQQQQQLSQPPPPSSASSARFPHTYNNSSSTSYTPSTSASSLSQTAAGSSSSSTINNPLRSSNIGSANNNSNTQHKRIISSSATSTSLSSHTMGGGGRSTTARDSSYTINTTPKAQYRGTDPHPDLEYDGRGRVIGGSDEAVCHTILFGESEAFAIISVQLMPLFSDIVMMLEFLTDFASIVLGARSNATIESKAAVIDRLKLVVVTILDKFPGMLLDSTIIAAVMHLLETISAHDDPLGNELKRSVFEKQKIMTDILSYSTHQEPILWSVQPKLQDRVSERLRAFLNRVDTTQAGNPNGYYQPKPITSVPPEIFLEITVEAWAAQIYYFHLAFSRDWSPTNDISLLFGTQYQYHRRSPLVFDSTNIHFLGRLLLDHLFGPGSNSKRLESTYRGKIIRHWIDLGNELKGCGDMVGWLAIATVLCSIPVMRLRDAWSHVSNDLRERVVKEWAPVVFDLERRLMIADMSKKSTYHVLAPQGIGVSYPKERVVPFFGDLCVKYEEGSTYRQCEGRLNRIKTAFQKWEDYLENIPQNDAFESAPIAVPSVQKLLYALLKNHYETPVPTPDQVLQMSLNVEPAAGGHYLKHHYAQKSPLVTGSYLPLIFIETNPTYKLFSKSALIAASGFQSGSNGIGGSGGNSNGSNSTISGLGGASKRSLRRSERENSTASTSSMTLGSFSNLTGIRHGSVGGQSMVSNTSSTNSSTASLQHNNNNHNAQQGGNSNNNPAYLQRSNSFPPAIKQQATTTGVSNVDASSRQFVSQHSSRHVLMKNVRDVLNVGTRLYHLGNGIIVKSFEDDNSSRPSSVIETPNRRQSTQSRPMSAQLNMSPRASPGAGNSNNNPIDSNALSKSLDRSINVVVRAANLERLVDILVLGINQFNHFLNPEDFEGSDESDFKPPQLKIDMDANTLTFFATFRSFCSPIDLLESLKRRFIGARAAAVAIVDVSSNRPSFSTASSTPRDDSNGPGVSRTGAGGDEAEHSTFESQESFDTVGFPYWDSPCDMAVEKVPWKTVAQIQMGVLEACHLWVSQYFGDFVNDLGVRDGFLDLLKVFEKELEVWRSPAELKDEYKGYLKSIETLHKKVRKLFIKKSYRPNDVKVQMPSPATATRTENLLIGGAGSINAIEKFVDDVNTVVAGYFSLVQLSDWMELFEVLEVQSADLVGFFNYRTPPYSNDDEVVIQDIFSYLDALYRDSPDDKVVKWLPHPIQELLKLHQNIVNYVTSQICDPSLHKDDRVGKIQTVLKALGIAKKRMQNVDLFPNEEPGSPFDMSPESGISTTIPGFLESAIVRAILRPESRMFASSWLQASKDLARHYGTMSFSGHLNTLEPCIPDIAAEYFKHESCYKPLVPCIGWIVERMLEIVCYVPNLSLENNTLINFDKRRYIYNLITNVMNLKQDLDAANIVNQSADSTFLKKMAYIMNPDKNLYHMERRNIRDAATKEAKEYSRASLKNRVFTAYVSAELEKQKRDSKQHELLERQAREMSKKNRIKQQPSYASVNTSSEKKSRSRFGGLLKAVRPISMAFGSSFSSTPNDKVVTPYDLPDISSLGEGKCKSMLQINLENAEIVSSRQLRIPGLFKVSNGGTDNVFQATSDQDADDWVTLLLRAKKHAKVLAELKPAGVFGVSINIVCKQEGRSIPRVVDALLNEIEARGLDEVGLYRVPGSVASVNALKAAFDAGADVDMEDDRWYDINTVAGCFKLYLRDLPETLFTVELFEEFVAAGTANDKKKLRRVTAKLPFPNFKLLKRVFEHLALVARHGSVNKMDAVNLAIVFSMSFLPRTSVTSSVSNDLGAMQNIMKLFINHPDYIFTESELSDDEEEEEEEEEEEPEQRQQQDQQQEESSEGPGDGNSERAAENEGTSQIQHSMSTLNISSYNSAEHESQLGGEIDTESRPDIPPRSARSPPKKEENQDDNTNGSEQTAHDEDSKLGDGNEEGNTSDEVHDIKRESFAEVSAY